MTRHIRLIGDRRADREAWTEANIESALSARCHQRLRGPYAGVDEILAPVLRDAVRRWPALVGQYRFELLYGMPELEQVIGPAPRTLASDSSLELAIQDFSRAMELPDTDVAELRRQHEACLSGERAGMPESVSPRTGPHPVIVRPSVAGPAGE